MDYNQENNRGNYKNILAIRKRLSDDMPQKLKKLSNHHHAYIAFHSLSTHSRDSGYPLKWFHKHRITIQVTTWSWEYHQGSTHSGTKAQQENATRKKTYRNQGLPNSRYQPSISRWYENFNTFPKCHANKRWSQELTCRCVCWSCIGRGRPPGQ